MSSPSQEALSETSSLVVCQTAQGVDVRATLLRFTLHSVVFEVYNPHLILRTSEVLTSFQIIIQNRPVYSGKAVITSLVNIGTILVCEAALDESWVDAEIFSLAATPESLRGSYEQFFQRWQRTYKIVPEFKSIVADIQMFLTDLRLWLEQVELGVRAMPSGDRFEAERKIVQELSDPISFSLNFLFEKFELIAAGIEAGLQPAHSVFARRQLHSLLLCSPFLHRIYRKPLGYAGDYEMVNMILRDPHEGSSLFSKSLNYWILRQAPAEAHRNRVKFLTQRIVEETLAARARGGVLRVYNLGCGPANEVANFLKGYELSNHSEFTLLDFNEETITCAESVINEAKQKHHRVTPIHLIKKSVFQVLKAAGRRSDEQYDLVYCAGLFDYLQDRVCQQLTDIFYGMLAPGGLLLVTNVDFSNPIQNIMGYIFEWHLIYRNGKQLAELAPTDASPDWCKVSADTTGGNIFLEVRKPRNPI
jgi:extracellular factor (EF) 3-hydroxypalmitic acid methyl ester biosynthesis protein